MTSVESNNLTISRYFTFPILCVCISLPPFFTPLSFPPLSHILYMSCFVYLVVYSNHPFSSLYQQQTRFQGLVQVPSLLETWLPPKKWIILSFMILHSPVQRSIIALNFGISSLYMFVPHFIRWVSWSQGSYLVVILQVASLLCRA